MNKVRKIVLTGGPCAGKTEVVKALSGKFPGRLLVIPEVATGLLSIPAEKGGPGVPGKDLDWSQEWQNNFQEMIFKKQLEIEGKAREYAESLLEPTIILCDRGLLDSAAYLESGEAEFEQKFGMKASEARNLYDMVIHLRSLATENPAAYERLAKTNPNRFEDLAMARTREMRLLEAWRGHDHIMRLGEFGTLEEKADFCHEVIDLTFQEMDEQEETAPITESTPELTTTK